MLWDETRNGRSGDDLASALVKILKEIVKPLQTNTMVRFVHPAKSKLA